MLQSSRSKFAVKNLPNPILGFKQIKLILHNFRDIEI